MIGAKILIAKYWKSDIVPTKREWQMKCQYILVMSLLTAINRLRNGPANVLISFPKYGLNLD